MKTQTLLKSIDKADIQAVNDRFKAAKLGVTIRQRGNRLYVRAVLPPKPGSEQTEEHQQDVKTGYKVVSAGLKAAEVMAKQIAGEIAGKSFDWTNYGVEAPKSNQDKTVKEWIAALETKYFRKHPRNSKTATSWSKNYYTYLKRLPQDQVLTQAVLEETLDNTPANSCPRKQMAKAFKALCQLAGIEVGFIQEIEGTYSSLRPAPRNLPSDQEILTAVLQIPDAEWQWVAGMLATFGLRPHEVFHLNVEDIHRIRIGEPTKTGEHWCQPLFPEWIDRFNLAEPKLPPVLSKLDIASGDYNRQLGAEVGKAFKRYKLPFRPYDLRHAWAVRAIKCNIPTSLAARCMGHSVQIHTRIYEAWMTEEFEREVWQKALQALKGNVAEVMQMPSQQTEESQSDESHESALDAQRTDSHGSSTAER